MRTMHEIGAQTGRSGDVKEGNALLSAADRSMFVDKKLIGNRVRVEDFVLRQSRLGPCISESTSRSNRVCGL